MSDWIKLRSDLDTDPRVFAIADLLSATAQSYILAKPARDLFGGVSDAVTRDVLRDVTISALCRVWFAANRHTTDGIFKNASLDYLDILARVPGFGRAMAAVGYAVHDPAAGTVTLPRFEEYNHPNKNGQRSKDKRAERNQRYREGQKLKLQEAHKAATAPASNPPPQDAEKDVLKDDSPSNSSSPSISESESESKTPESEPPASVPIREIRGQPSGASTTDHTTSTNSEPEPLTLFTLESIKPRISALRPAWAKMPAWSYEEDAALLAALPNLQALDERDWARLESYMRWANSTSNQGRDAHRVTSRRHLFLAELPAYLDRANTHARHTGSAGSAGSKPRAKSQEPTPAQAPELPPSQNAAAFGKLLEGYDIKRPTVPTKPTPAAA